MTDPKKTLLPAQKPKLPETVQVLTDVKEKPWVYDFFAAARRLEADHDGPGFGRSLTPSDDPIRFGQRASMAFPPRTIFGIENGPSAPIIKLFFSGLFGPNGALPDHLTERAEERRRHNHDNTLEAFADIFHHRFFSLFYRAWADADPVLCLDNEEAGDYFKKFMGAIGGVYQSQSEGFSDFGRRYYMSHIGPSGAKPESLERVLNDVFNVDAQIVEFLGSWVDIQDEDKASLSGCALSSQPMLGDAIWSRSSTFEIELGPLDAHEFASFLPGGKNTKALRDIVITIVGMDYGWHVRLKRKSETITGIKLGEDNQLGFNTWMCGSNGSNTFSRADMLISGERYNFH
jgi:type VI secretion system protein ImpH